MPEGNGIAVKYENTITQSRQIRKFDMVVLNGALQPSLAKSKDSGYHPVLDTEGLLSVISPNIKSCGFCREPVDVEASVIQASSAALRAQVGEEQ